MTPTGRTPRRGPRPCPCRTFASRRVRSASSRQVVRRSRHTRHSRSGIAAAMASCRVARSSIGTLLGERRRQHRNRQLTESRSVRRLDVQGIAGKKEQLPGAPSPEAAGRSPAAPPPPTACAASTAGSPPPRPARSARTRPRWPSTSATAPRRSPRSRSTPGCAPSPAPGGRWHRDRARAGHSGPHPPRRPERPPNPRPTPTETPKACKGEPQPPKELETAQGLRPPKRERG